MLNIFASECAFSKWLLTLQDEFVDLTTSRWTSNDFFILKAKIILFNKLIIVSTCQICFPIIYISLSALYCLLVNSLFLLIFMMFYVKKFVFLLWFFSFRCNIFQIIQGKTLISLLFLCFCCNIFYWSKFEVNKAKRSFRFSVQILIFFFSIFSIWHC